jgi:hypothetical protein
LLVWWFLIASIAIILDISILIFKFLQEHSETTAVIDVTVVLV